jgi:hypothetical protein
MEYGLWIWDIGDNDRNINGISMELQYFVCL